MTIIKDVHLPRNKDIEENEDFENKTLAEQKLISKARQTKIDDLASIMSTGKKEEEEEDKEDEEDEAKELSKFIEIIIKLPKP